MKNSFILALVGALAFGKSGGCLQAQPSPQVGAQQAGIATIETQNPGFEGEFTPLPTANAPGAKARIVGAIAPGWSDNSDWAEVDVEYGRDPLNPHRGQSAQKLVVKRVTNGAVQFTQAVSLHKGRIHLWKLWLRGQAGSAVTLAIRQAGAPYAEYATQTASLSPEWQEFRVFGSIPEDTQGFLMVRATSPQTLWVDDSQLQDLTSATADAPPYKGNMISGGGSFEAGVPYGWSVRYEGEQEFRPQDPRPQIDVTTAAVGQKSLRCAMPVGSNLRIASPLLNFNFGREHTLSFWAKARLLNTPLSARVEGAFDGNVALTTEWKRYTFTGKIPFLPYTSLRFSSPDTSGPNTVWLDGVQLEEASTASPGYLAPEPVELALQLPQPGHVLLGNEKGVVNLGVASQLPGRQLPKGAQLQLSATALNGQHLAVSPVALPATDFVLPAFNNRYGMWKLRAQVMNKEGGPLSAPYNLVWARLPNPKTIDPNRSYFGLHLPLSQNYFDIARRIGVRRTRLHDVSMISKWSLVEPSRDQFRYFDEGIDLANRSGIAVLGMLDGAPAWTTTVPREGYWGIWNIPDQPGAVERWDNYVRHIVGHFKGRINQWEIWNEPWGSWWLNSGNPHATPELYSELSRHAYSAAKAANPDATILGIDTYPGSTWTGAVMPQITPSNFDGMSYHEYNDATFGGPDAIPFLRRDEFTKAQLPFGQPKPLWNTEGGLFSVGSWLAPETGGLPVAQQPAYMVRFDVTQMAAGVRAFFVYAMHTDPVLGDTSTATGEYDRSVKPILAARAVLASLVDGLGTPTRSEPAKGVDFYTYPGAKVSVAWSYDGSDHTLTPPPGTKMLDIWGNPQPATRTISVGNEPVYFVRP